MRADRTIHRCSYGDSPCRVGLRNSMRFFAIFLRQVFWGAFVATSRGKTVATDRGKSWSRGSFLPSLPVHRSQRALTVSGFAAASVDLRLALSLRGMPASRPPHRRDRAGARDGSEARSREAQRAALTLNHHYSLRRIAKIVQTIERLKKTHCRWQSFSSLSRHKLLLPRCPSREAEEGVDQMQIVRLPLETWLVIDCSRGEHVVSTHVTPDEAERHRDKLSAGRSGVQFTACMVIEPVAQGLSRPCR